MRNLILIAFIAILSKSFAADNEKIIKSKPEKIIVYTQGAQVHRNATTNLSAGPNTIIFTGLENCINQAAIQANGTGSFIITDVQYESHYPELAKTGVSGDLKFKKLTKQINDSIISLNYDIEETQSKLDVLSTEKNVLLNYNLYKGLSKKDSIAFLKDGLAFLREKLYNINSEYLRFRKEKEKIEVKRNILYERLNTINAELTQNTQKTPTDKVDYRIIVHIISDAATQANITLNYPITNAGWTPSYDLRALSSEQNIKLTYKAQIHQNSGNDWSNVKLVLSTANPNRSYTIPQLSPWLLGYNAYYNKKRITDDIKLTKEKYAMPTAAASTYDGASLTYNSIADAEAEQTYNYTSVSENVIETEYDIKLNYTIESDGKEHYLAILQKDLKSLYRYKAIPKISSSVYLTALLPDWEDAITIGGSASIYYDGSFIGTTALNPAGVEDTLQLSLGIDKNVAIKRQKITDKCYRKLLGEDLVHQQSYDIIVKNMRASKLEIDIEDQLPITQDKTISIDKKELSGAKYDELTGLVKWRIGVSAKDTKKINLTYQIKAPKSTPVAFN